MARTTSFKLVLRLVFVTTLLLPQIVCAAQLNFQSDTILRLLERDTATEESAAVLPIYQYIQLDIDNPDEPGLAFHLYGWGRWDTADNDYYDDSTAGELLYSYLEYSGEQAHFNARLGRQYIFEGVTNDSIDGIRVRSDLGKYFSGSVFAGLPVAYSGENGRDGDSIYGGRLANHTSWYDLGVSYQTVESDSDDAGEKAGTDISVYLPLGIGLYGRSIYNVDTEDISEHSYELRFGLGPVAVRPFFQQFDYDDYFGDSTTGINPFAMLAGTEEKLTVAGAELSLPVGDSLVLVATYKNYDYDVFHDSSQYHALQATWTSEENNQIGGEAGVMSGDAAENRYYLLRAFGYWQSLPEALPLGFLSGEVVYVDYDQPIYEEDSSLFISLGCGKKFMEDALSVKLSADYSIDPYFDEDIQGMLTLSYRFSNEF